MMFFGGWTIILWVLVIALIIWVVAKLVRRGSLTTDTSRKQEPMEIASERYAKGEINKEEFERIKKGLS